MDSTAVGDNIYQITRMGAVNTYLVRDEDGNFIAVDTAVPGMHHKLLLAAKALGGRITKILLTHAHSDHVGSLLALHRALPKTPIFIGEREARLLHGDLSLDPNEPQQALKKAFFAPMPDMPVETISGGDHVGPLEAIATPGHTPGHVSFFDSRDGTLFAGDAFQTKGGVAVSGILRWGFPLPALANWDLPLALHSAIRLRNMRPARLAAGHGCVLDDPMPELDNAIGEARFKTSAPPQMRTSSAELSRQMAEFR